MPLSISPAGPSASWRTEPDTGSPLHSTLRAPVAQGIERSPAEAEAARSNRAGRMGAGEPMVPPPTPSFWVAHAVEGSWPPAAVRSLTGDRTASADGSYSPLVTDARLEFEPEPWGDDPQLREVLGEQGADGFRALLDGIPGARRPAVGDPGRGGEVVDFAFGYGNPAMVSGFRIPAETPDRYTLLEALPRMRGSHAFDAYVEVCDTG